MKITKARLKKIFLREKQTKKKIKNNIKLLNHNSTYRKKHQFNLRHKTLKNL